MTPMTVPIDLKQATAEFDRFLLDLRDTLELNTTNMAWGALLGVLDTFRRRLTPEQALAFAKALPPLLRAVFVQDWHLEVRPIPFADRAALEAEVRAYHRDHQFAPEGAIARTAAALRRHVDQQRFDACLAAMPKNARRFWALDDGRT
jgi:uncharacterized protein (DUF2267 family)